jgi:hypothetical protein
MFGSFAPGSKATVHAIAMNDSPLFDRIQLNDSRLSTESKCLESTEYKCLERRERLRSPTPAAQRRNSLAQREALGTCSKKPSPFGATPSICLVEAIMGKITTLQRGREYYGRFEKQLAKS